MVEHTAHNGKNVGSSPTKSKFKPSKSEIKQLGSLSGS